MDLRKIRNLIEIFDSSNLSEIEIRDGEESIRLSRVAKVGSEQPTVALPPAGSAPNFKIDEVVGDESLSILSPMVGSFYAATSPEDSPLVKVGDKVTEGHPICVIEAMKIFNQIESEHSGTIVEILKKDGDPVEFGEVLFRLKE